MKILWLTNVPLPEATELLKIKTVPFGGWLVKTAVDLSNSNDVDLNITFPFISAEKIVHLRGSKIDYFAFPSKGKTNEQNTIESFLETIIDLVNPDLVHIFGTEYLHSLCMVRVCNQKGIKNIISIQGLTSIYANHYMAALPINVQLNYTFRDFLKRDNLLVQQKKFRMRGLFEINAIKETSHVLGRTIWDKACTQQINPNAKYHYCNETLREEFYKHIWSVEKCDRYSIFTSQASYPIKGIHFVLEAMPIVLKKYPQAKLYIAGRDITNSSTIKDKLKISSYGKYIKKLIKKNNLQDSVIFTGILDEKGMCNRYLKSNVFVCPSSIENSPNSLGEAMILGVPCVASYVGGVSDMLEDKVEGFLYQADAPYMMAHYIIKIFEDEELAIIISKNARRHALKTHDGATNTKRMIQIYEEVIAEKE